MSFTVKEAVTVPLLDVEELEARTVTDVPVLP